MASPLRSQMSSGGDAVFVGDGNAGRDIINISRQPRSNVTMNHS
jgi:hypothetical protein